jgi:hypothetical protein
MDNPVGPRIEPGEPFIQIVRVRRRMHMYSINQNELNDLSSTNTRFTIYLSFFALFVGLAVACWLSGLTVSEPWTATQIATFRLAPAILGVVALGAGAIALNEYRQHEGILAVVNRECEEPAQEQVAALTPTSAD